MFSALPVDIQLSSHSYLTSDLQGSPNHHRWLEFITSCRLRAPPPVTQLLLCFFDSWTPQHQWQLSFISEYTNNILYVPRVDNVVANTISRPPAGAAQQSQVASLCDCPPAAVIPLQSTGVTKQPQVASLCAGPPAAIIKVPSGQHFQPPVEQLTGTIASLPPTPIFLTTSVDISELSAAQGTCQDVAPLAG